MKSLRNHPRLKKNQGVAMVMTLVILIVLSVVMIASYNNATLGQFIQANLIDQPLAGQGASTCEQYMIRRITSPSPDFSVYSKAPGSNLGINCTTTSPTIVEKNTKIIGSSTEIKTVVLRFSSRGLSPKGSQVTTFTDVQIPDVSS